MTEQRQQPRKVAAPSKTAATRENRELSDRDANSRPKQWQPASLLPDPAPIEGITFRWVRKSTLGVADPTNLSRSQREGWEPCRLRDHPEMKLSVDPDAHASDLVEIGGLILCRAPAEQMVQRNEHYRKASQSQMESVDSTFMRENDDRMPLFKNRSTKVSFGGGS